MMIAITRSDGGVSIMSIIDEKADVEKEIEKWSQSHSEKYISHREISASDIPPDRTFRNAWKPDLSHDMARARDIWRNKMREARAPKLAALDVQYSRADEAGNLDQKKAIAAAKQELRDVTSHPDIEAATTPDDLKKVWPKALS